MTVFASAARRSSSSSIARCLGQEQFFSQLTLVRLDGWASLSQRGLLANVLYSAVFLKQIECRAQ